MNEQEWRAERDDRTVRYAGRCLDPGRWIHVRVDPEYAVRYDGQVALLTTANLLARMSPSIAIEAPRARLVEPLPWAGEDLADFAVAMMHRIDPFGRFLRRPSQPGDYEIRLGSTGAGFVVHGSGWGSYIGSEASPLGQSDGPNPFGPAFAAITAAAWLFSSDFGAPAPSRLFNSLAWTMTAPDASAPQPSGGMCLGELWVAGAGSVGTAILFFLTLLTTNHSCTLFDMDEVKTHNLDRSPIFVDADVGSSKVLAVEGFLRRAGVSSVRAEACALHESPIWRGRQEGTPDLLIAAANEQHVRYHIESAFPPVQVYGTTGRNWQAAVIRHVPLVDPCSKCLFPRESGAPTDCATAARREAPNAGGVDAALPFLSFGAGLMAAAEVVKLSLPGFPHSPNRALLNTLGEPRLVSAPLPRAENCVCADRSAAIQRRMIEGSRYAHLSEGSRTRGPTCAI